MHQQKIGQIISSQQRMLQGLLKEHARCVLVLKCYDFSWLFWLLFILLLIISTSIFCQGEARTCGTHTQGDTVYLWQASPWTCRLYLCKSTILPSCWWINWWPTRKCLCWTLLITSVGYSWEFLSQCSFYWCRAWIQQMLGLVLWGLQQAFCNLQEGCPQEDLTWIVWSFYILQVSNFQGLFCLYMLQLTIQSSRFLKARSVALCSCRLSTNIV